MFILGDLIVVDPNESRIPLPWWHRSPLAFESNTHVTVALTSPTHERPGDLLVSVVNPQRWQDCHTVSCYYKDSPGVIAKVFGLTAETNWNVALAETVTIDSGQHHALELVCEPKGSESRKPNIRSLLKRIRAHNFSNVISAPLRGPQPGIAWHRTGQVQAGWVTGNDGKGLSWRAAVEAQLHQFNLVGHFDTSRLVMYADTDKRCLRIMFPRIGVQNVIINHADEKGALEALTIAIQKAGFNVLTSLLKRGGASKGDAVLVAICEPTPEHFSEGPSSKLSERLINEINKIDQKFRAEAHVIKGKQGSRVLYLRHPEDVVIRVPKHLAFKVHEKRAGRVRGKRAVFVAHRFVRESSKYVAQIRRVLSDLQCIIVDSPISPKSLETSFEEVSSAMWSSDGAIVLVERPPEPGQAMSYNLSHEFGFFQGQSKPILLLVENDAAVQKDLDLFTNAKGVQTPHFDPSFALDPSSPTSIQAIITRWLEEWKSPN